MNIVHTVRAAAFASLFAISCGAHCFAQKQEMNFPRFTLSPGVWPEDTPPKSGAKLCLLLEQRPNCFEMPSMDFGPSAGGIFQFNLDPRSERLPLEGGDSWVFFSATFSAGGSGTLERIAVLRYQKDGSIKNLMPYVAATNVSQRAMWNVPEASPYPVLVHADYLWSKNEIHFGDHFYIVEAWVFDPEKDQYVRTFEYKTSQRYGGGDEKPIRVLQGERSEILRRLNAH